MNGDRVNNGQNVSATHCVRKMLRSCCVKEYGMENVTCKQTFASLCGNFAKVAIISFISMQFLKKKNDCQVIGWRPHLEGLPSWPGNSVANTHVVLK